MNQSYISCYIKLILSTRADVEFHIFCSGTFLDVNKIGSRRVLCNWLLYVNIQFRERERERERERVKWKRKIFDSFGKVVTFRTKRKRGGDTFYLNVNENRNLPLTIDKLKKIRVKFQSFLASMFEPSYSFKLYTFLSGILIV